MRPPTWGTPAGPSPTPTSPATRFCPTTKTTGSAQTILNPQWLAVQAAGGTWARPVIGYWPDTSVPDDASILPMTGHDFIFTPDGFWRAC